MLGRARLDHNQENPTQRSNLLPSKTPLRQQAGAGPSKPGLTGGKGLGGTAKGGRVLGDKDGNKGKTESIRLFTDALQKPCCAPLLSPPHAGPLPSHLRTPSPALQRIAARLLSPEVEVEMEVEEEPEEEEVESDPEVEYAGASSADYDEPYTLSHPPPSPIGELLSRLPLLPTSDLEAWREADAIERAATHFALDIVPSPPSPPPTREAMFPVPRRPLAAKATNARPASAASRLSLAPLTKAPSRAPFALRKSLAPSGGPTSAAKPKWGTPSTSRAPTTSSRPPSTLTMPLRPSLSAPRPSLSAQLLRPLSRTLPRPPAALPLRHSTSQPLRTGKSSASSLRSLRTVVEDPSVEEGEKALGIWGIEEGMGALEGLGTEDEEGFRFEVED